jgi:alginate O-acetyltransferase complex protein AlgI
MLVGIAWPLAALIIFKYANLLAHSAGALGADVSGWQEIFLPIGLSFFVFGAISYSMDVFRTTVPAEPSFVNYATYQSMFGHLVAGPVVRYKWVAERLKERVFHRAEFMMGVERFIMGFAQKVLIADTLAPVVDAGYTIPDPTTLDVTLSVVAFSLQLYFDFAGYSAMAIGLGLMVGLKFPENFDNPYLSSSIAEFWRRWHISLSTWLRDYLYIPLGGNRRGPVRTYINLALVMLLGGLWHGASWNFVIWGAIHGGMLCFERFMGRRSPYHFLPDAARVMLTFLLVNLGWVFFRAADLPAAVAFCRSLVGLATPVPNEVLLGGVIYQPYYLATFAIAALVVWTAPQTWDWTRRITPFKAVVILALFLLSLVVLSTQAFNPFIYFIF